MQGRNLGPKARQDRNGSGISHVHEYTSDKTAAGVVLCIVVSEKNSHR